MGNFFIGIALVFFGGLFCTNVEGAAKGDFLDALVHMVSFIVGALGIGLGVILILSVLFS